MISDTKNFSGCSDTCSFGYSVGPSGMFSSIQSLTPSTPVRFSAEASSTLSHRQLVCHHSCTPPLPSNSTSPRRAQSEAAVSFGVTPGSTAGKYFRNRAVVPSTHDMYTPSNNRASQVRIVSVRKETSGFPNFHKISIHEAMHSTHM